jgi:hypothetical protein
VETKRSGWAKEAVSFSIFKEGRSVTFRGKLKEGADLAVIAKGDSAPDNVLVIADSKRDCSLRAQRLTGNELLTLQAKSVTDRAQVTVVLRFCDVKHTAAWMVIQLQSRLSPDISPDGFGKEC